MVSTTPQSASGTKKRSRNMAPRPNHGNGESVSGLSNRVSKLETNVEVLGNRMTSLAEDIAISDRKQDNFFDEWRRQKESERIEKEKMIQARQTTPRDMIMMLAACVTMCAAIAGFGNYIIQTNLNSATGPLTQNLLNIPAAIEAAVSPLTERQNASSQASLQQRESIERLATTISLIQGTLSELKTSNLDMSQSIEDLDRRSLESGNDRARLGERLKAESELRIQADTNLREELRSFKGRMESGPRTP